MMLQLFGKMSELVCNEYKKMVNKPETSTTYNRSLKIMAEIAANKDKQIYTTTLKNIGLNYNPFKSSEVINPDVPANTLTYNNAIRPNHYGGENNPYEVFNVLEAWGLDKDFYLGNVIKYIARAGKKDKSKELEDLEKAEVYLKRRIAELKK